MRLKKHIPWCVFVEYMTMSGRIWWFYKLTRYSGLEIQEKAAVSVDYDVNNRQERWIGEHPKAVENARDIRDIIGPGKIVNKGDTLWVYHLFCLGSRTDRILDSLVVIHDAGIRLRIYAINYYDTDSRDDYMILKGALEFICYSSRQKAKPKHKKPGRPKRDLRFESLTPEGQNVIRHYYRKDGTYTLKSALQALKGCAKDGGSIGRDSFYEIMRRYDQSMKYSEWFRNHFG